MVTLSTSFNGDKTAVIIYRCSRELILARTFLVAEENYSREIEILSIEICDQNVNAGVPNRVSSFSLL